jgi:hypothetical protein
MRANNKAADFPKQGQRIQGMRDADRDGRKAPNRSSNVEDHPWRRSCETGFHVFHDGRWHEDPVVSEPFEQEG